MAGEVAVTHEQAAEALDSLDDYARMDCGVDPIGPRGVLERYIAQQQDACAALVRERDEAVAEVERLRGCLTQANANHEEFERKWYLACDDRDRLREALEACAPLVNAVFDEYCSDYTEENETDEQKVSYPEDRCYITFGMIRKARAALAGRGSP